MWRTLTALLLSLCLVTPTLAQVIRPPFPPAGGSGNGNVTGAGSSTDGEIPLYSGVTGKSLGNSNATLTSDSTFGASTNNLVPTALAVRTFVQNQQTGMQWKNAVRAATTVAGTLASSFENGDTVDGVVLATNDRIIIKNQTDAKENGYYTVNASGAPTRATDADTGAEILNATALVTAGTANANTVWTCNNISAPTIGVSNITFAQVNAANTYTAGTGLGLAGNTFSIDSTVTTLTGSQTLTNKTMTDPLISRIYGGSAAGSALTLQSTSSGAPSGDYVRVMVGGAEQARWLTGYLGIGTTAPAHMLHIVSTQGLKVGANEVWPLRIDHTISSTDSVPAQNKSINVLNTYNATNATTPGNIGSVGISVTTNYGLNGVAVKGSALSLASALVAGGAFDPHQETAAFYNVIRVDIGTGYTQLTGPTGRHWLMDTAINGPIGVQPDALNGITVVLNNYYNGRAVWNDMNGLNIVTHPGTGGGIDPTHTAATTYSAWAGIAIAGYTTGGTRGWNIGLQIGGSASTWMGSDAGPIETSAIGTGIDIRDYGASGTPSAVAGLYFHNRHTNGATIPDIVVDAHTVSGTASSTMVRLGSLTAPSGPGAFMSEIQNTANATVQVFYTGVTGGTSSVNRHTHETGGSTEIAHIRTGTQTWVIGLDSAHSNTFAISSADDHFGASTQLRVGSAGRVMIHGGTSTAGAFLHLPAGASGTSNAPLKFTLGTNLTTAEAGAMEYSNPSSVTQLFFTLTGTTRKNVLVATDGGTVPTTAAGTPTTRYGGDTKYLGDPVAWADVIINGTTYHLPLF